MTVLVLATETDPTADRVVAALTRRDVPTVRMDTAWFPDRVSIAAELRNGWWTGTLSVDGQAIDIEEIRSAWYRSPGSIDLGGVLTSLPVMWVNRPSRNADAAHRPIQLITAARCGLPVPDTLVTNEQHAVIRFAEQGETVSRTTCTHLLGPAELGDLKGVELGAHQFQRWVPKAHAVRMIAVGEQLFAVAIHARSIETYIDWRTDYSAHRYERVEPPVGVAAGVRRYCAYLGLAYGAFDFVVQPDGEWVFLECNPGGQYGWIEDAIHAPITETVADLLEKGNAG